MPVLKSPVPAKRRRLMEELKARICGGRFHYGDRLPSVKDLTEELHASYVTVSLALKELEREGYVECRHGVGSFVCYVAPQAQPAPKRVNLICPAYDEPGDGLISRFMEHGSELFAAAGWEVERCPIAGDLSMARSKIADPGAYSVIFGFRPYWENFTASIEHVRNRVVLIGERSETDGIACITCDETQTIRLALDHLRRQGYQKTGLICGNLHSHLELQRAAAWRSLCMESGLSFAWCRDCCFDLELPAQAPTEPYVRDLFAKLQRSGRISELDSVITPDDDTAAQWIGTLLDHGIRVPEDFAVISIGNTSLARLFRPQITSIDHNFETHLTTALAILESRAAGHPDCGLFHLCLPRLVVRSSSVRVAEPVAVNQR